MTYDDRTTWDPSVWMDPTADQEARSAPIPPPPERRPARLTAVAAVVAGVAVVAVAAALVVAKPWAGSTPVAQRAAATQPATANQPAPITMAPATTAPAATKTASPAPAGTQPRTTSTTSMGDTATVGSDRATNLDATPAVKAQLVQALLAVATDLGPSDVDGTVPGTTYFAKDTTTGTQYAVTSYVSSPSLTARLEAENVPYASDQYIGIYSPFAFSKAPGGSWRLIVGGLDYMGDHCPSPSLPPAVLAVWGQSEGNCHFRSS